jgi:hypothetical protein
MRRTPRWWLAWTLLVISFAACAPTRPCKAGTLFLTVTFAGSSADADLLTVVVSIDGVAHSGQQSHQPGSRAGTVEVDFPNEYPAGKSVSITLTATANGLTVGRVSTEPLTLAQTCQALTLGVDAQSGPGGSSDLGLFDLGTADASSMSGDMLCTPGIAMCAAATTLRTCVNTGDGYVDSPCSLGCAAAEGSAHCRQFYPTPPLTTDDLQEQGLVAFTSPTRRLLFDWGTGAIMDGSQPYRAANTDPSVRQVINGIAFRRTNGMSIWTFKSLVVSNNAVNNVPSIVFSSADAQINNAVALVSVGDANITGIIDARGGYDRAENIGTCYGLRTGGPGGGAGGGGSTSAVGAGAGSIGVAGSGGGGAGNGERGGYGGADGTLAADAGPKVPQSLMVGGSGGGAGATGAIGGGGGGAIRIVSTGAVTVSGGGINAGGCQGATDYSSKSGGGGGGSGGSILLEAVGGITISSGMLAANGGGGGGGGGYSGPVSGSEAGKLSGVAAAGGAGDKGKGGNGGAATAVTGGSGGRAAGGGGGVGWIRLNTTTGVANLISPSVLSPRESDGQTSQGLIDLH